MIILMGVVEWNTKGKGWSTLELYIKCVLIVWNSSNHQPHKSQKHASSFNC